MDFDIPAELAEYPKQPDGFIEREIKPRAADDNIRFFDHRREKRAHRLGAPVDSP
jgi:hypothetical protein